jgi:hypothetical protein
MISAIGNRRSAIASRAGHAGGCASSVIRLRSYSDEWYTPAHIPAALGRFDMDPCAGPSSSHATRNVRLPEDGLKVPWSGRVWFNPPYSNLYDWLALFQAHGNGIALVNMRCETIWFQSLASHCDGLLFLKGRLAFEDARGNSGNCSTVGSVLVAYGKRNARALARSGLPGLLCNLPSAMGHSPLRPSAPSASLR